MGLSALRLGYGLLLMLAPDHVYRVSAKGPSDPLARGVVRVLGARQMAQGAWTIKSGTASSLVLGAGVDALHAASMAGVAWLDPERRRPAGLDAMSAASFSLAGLALAVRMATRPSR
jgi:hypothetical protein